MFTEYATLSHCWGADTAQMIKLTTGNLKQMQQAIDVTSLSPTFQDAIEIARGLKVPYIWIDALCIIQDSVDDWSKESPKMGQYYRGGKIMISALASSSAQHGILQPRVPALPPVKLRIEGKDAHLRIALDAAVTVQQYDPWNDVRGALSVTPLRRRGWTLQESLFAPRIIHYTSQQLVWQCKTCMASEDNQYHWNCHNPKIRQYTQYMNLEPTAKDANGKPGHRKRVQDTGWYRMIHAFTCRQLSYMSDMLPAVSGLAYEVQKLTGSAYLAGIWNESPDAFVQNLTWQINASPYDVNLPLTPRPSLNGSPSWSWASIVGCVEFENIIEDSYHRLPQAHVDPRFLIMQTKASTGNQYGQVQGGRIAVIGTCHVYEGPLTFAAVTARQKAEKTRKTEEKILRKKAKRLRDIGDIEQVKKNVDADVKAPCDDEVAGGNVIGATEPGDPLIEDENDSDYSDHNIYLASMDWKTADNNFDFEAYDAEHIEENYGHHDLTMDIPDDKYRWSDGHLILFLGRWDAYPFDEKSGDEVGEQWFLVLKRVASRDGEWNDRNVTEFGIQTVHEEESWRSEFPGDEGEAVPYYERVGVAKAEMDYQLPITEEEGWARKKFYFV